MHDSLAVLISRATWVSVSPMSGVVGAQSSTDLVLTFLTNNFPEESFWASLQIESNDPDESMYILPIHMKVSTLTGLDDQMVEIPKEFKLYQNSPNPFNPTTVIAYNLPRDSKVNLVIYNMLGQEIRTLVDGYQDAGFKSVTWDGRDNSGKQVSSGVYLYTLNSSDYTQSLKMILLR